MNGSCINKMKGARNMIICLTSTMKIMDMGSEEALERYIACIANGNKEALSDLYRNASAAVYGYALSILKNSHDAEDVLHDCFVNIHANAQNYRSFGKPMAWILTITKNLCLQKIRERNKTSDIPEEDWQNYISDCHEMTVNDKVIIEQCMTVLNDDERQIVLLHAVAGFKHREIASHMDMALATVLSKYNRAIKKLRAHLEKGEPSNDL